ncbi:sulfotransferase family 2 domain-containing protein [Marinomonas sp. GJ51-6]|uniref:sulfotransferase family 2 domain-containing protein n=1 Tax=Marinomonas sp. GJ51-6 TaxID=2992802 RepID=UPI002934E5D2|nr:sulfotransferase family 2 domain-containing protein [Marinomonas sp. GJ51-6]WOD06180.1 sulfotransferase family 2 domain-containing protein [Marinomonas sp. GJ51-6]
MLNYDLSKPLIFIHVPKTAGQSVKHIVKAWFDGNFFPHYYNEQEGGLPPKRDLEAISLDQNVCIYGHFNRLRGFGVEDYYPEVKQFITILRNPLEMAISSYFYIRSKAKSWKDQSRVPQGDLEEYLLNTPLNMLNHFPKVVTEDNYKEVLETYFIYIGTTERLLDSLQKIAAKLSMPTLLDLPHVNSTQRDEYKISPEVIEQFEHKNKLEYLVYQYALLNS